MKNRKLKSAGMIKSYCSFLDSAPPPPPATAPFPEVVVEVVAVVSVVVVVLAVETPCSFVVEDAENQDRTSFTARQVVNANHQTNESTQLTC